jgi:uncharacterized protein (TIGR00266 family)
MKIKVLSPGGFASAAIRLDAGERFISESGAMVRMTSGIDTDVTTRAKKKGGVLGGLKRLLGGDSFFLSTYTARKPAEVVIAPTLPGDIAVLQLDGSQRWMCAGGSYLGSGTDVETDMKFQGLKGFFSGESLFFLETSGEGPVVINAFGLLQAIDIDGDYTIDTGHVVAYEDSLQYDITKAGGSWLQSFLAGEGFVMNFHGRGRVLVQSHNPTEFGQSIGSQLPPRG